jgi:anti-anti-sigma factor
MKIKQRESEGVTILEISGQMHGGPENMRLLELTKELTAQDRKKLLLNLGKVKWVASNGLGILMTTKTHFEREGGTLKLCNLNDRVLTLFQVTKISAIMDVYESEDAALASFAG